MRNLLRSRPGLLATCFAAAALTLGAAASTAGADSIYWANYDFGGPGGLFSVNLAGGGAHQIDTTGGVVEQANGTVIDAATGKIYWGSDVGNKIYSANLSGGGGAELNTAGAAQGGFYLGMAIDPAAGRLYWANEGEDKISYANLNGSGGGDLDTTGATVEEPYGVAVDPALGRIYWTNSKGPDTVSYASLAGGGGGSLNTSGATPGGEPDAPAIDAANNTIYWGSYEGDRISYASLSGTGGGDLNTTGAPVDGPFGTAIDPTTGRIYWVNEIGGSIAYANLSGGGGGTVDTSGVTLLDAGFPVILKAPSPETAPEATGGPKPGSNLSCTPGGWAPDLTESFLYRAPQSTAIQWLNGAAPVAGATAGALKAPSVGMYACQVTATNGAGSTQQTSRPVAIFSVGKAKLNKKRGTATVAVTVPGAGALTLGGRLLVKQRTVRAATSTGAVELLVKPKGKAKKALAKKGVAKVQASISFLPNGAGVGSQVKTLTLKKTARG
jgi:DNA-binding beta-propeller fold protein YncE